jgi:hypothetical protein
MQLPHRENHLIERIGWLRAAVLGANDGIISTASLMIGVAAASTSPSEMLVAGIAGLVAGAMSMAAGEYVSVSSQADTEAADLERERHELIQQPAAELDELTGIYIERGVSPELARQVAEQMTANDAFAAHARDELGLAQHVIARPVQAALTSAATFTGHRNCQSDHSGHVGCLWRLPCLPRRSWGPWRPHGRSRYSQAYLPCDFLGGTRHDHNCCHRRNRWPRHVEKSLLLALFSRA